MDKVLKVINILLLSIVGMLLLIGVMVLVQGSRIDLGKAADWVALLSAVATAGTFAVAYAAYKKVPDWLEPKLKDRKFKFADELIVDFCALQHEALNLYVDMSQYVSSKKYSDDEFLAESTSIGNESGEYIKNIILLRAKMDGMKIWNLKPKNQVDFDNLIKQHYNLHGSFVSTRSFKLSIKGLLTEEANEYCVKMDDIYQSIVKNHSLIIKPYNELFEK